MLHFVVLHVICISRSGSAALTAPASPHFLGQGASLCQAVSAPPEAVGNTYGLAHAIRRNNYQTKICVGPAFL